MGTPTHQLNNVLMFNLAVRTARLSGIVLIVSLIFGRAVLADDSARRLVTGADLSQPRSIEIALNPNSYVVIRVAQRTADYQLALYRSSDATLIRQVNLSAHKAVDELMLVEASDCRQCRVELMADSLIDQRGTYQMTVETVAVTPSSMSTNSRAELETLRAISQVGELNHKLYQAQDDDTNYLALASQLLESSLTMTPQNAHTLQATFLALQVAGMQRQTEVVTELAQQIAATADQRISLYSIQAVYELARQADNIANKHALFRRGMADAITVSEPLLYAKGANYLAISLTREGRFEDSITLFKDVYEIYSREQHLAALMFALHNLSWASQRSGDLPKAISYAAQQKMVAEENQAQSSVIWSLYNMAIAYGELGDHFEADQFLDQALERYSVLPESEQRDNDGIYGAILEERAESLLRLGDVASARDLAILIKAHYEQGNFQRNLAHFGMLEGKIAIAAERFDDARDVLTETLEYYQKTEEGRSAGLAHFRLAELELTQGNLILGSTHNAAALKKLSGTEDYFSLAKAFSQAVEVLNVLGAHTDAAALAAQVTNFIGTHGREDVEAEFAYRRAKVAQQLKQTDAALLWLNEAKRLLEEKLPKVKRRDLRQQYLALQKSLFELNIGLLVDQGQTEKALQVVESFKARTLKETINQVRNTQALPSALQQTRRLLHQQILQSATTWYSDPSRREVSLLANTRVLSTELEKVELDIAALQGKVQPNSPDDSLPAIPQLNNPSELMAFYFIGQQRSWMWLLESTGISVFELPAANELLPLVHSLKQQVSLHPRHRTAGNAYQQRQDLLSLGELLLGPIAKQVDFSKISNLTIIPDGPLHGLTFAPLQLANLDGPLLAHTAISYAPSYQALVALEQRAERNNSLASAMNVLVVADPIDLTLEKSPFERLPATVYEAQQIRSILGDRVQVLMGEGATKKNLLKALSHRYSILHFATHGLLNNQTPALSGLVFSRNSTDAHFWLTPEISSTDLQANLVVLSACESSIGREVAGEGLLSLSRAFIEAGASHVIGTLWKVQDTATAQLTSRFYSKLLDDSLAVSVALQMAQLEVYNDQQNDWRDPYYWAGFQLQGGWQTLTYGSDKSTE
ncbi:CHAT domain-containing tetratricopeptide repeat protein [Arenicella xantha]|uniref:Tetratricopeptide repeat protein n=1 Tax=Arenicella xantha TaxID=644221 RepID=A0A395JH16_9GAMM|nr:CHAT domain-containing tetratricopeptide repeat protein [Arenicella xantha]RBP49135.1 tetratricopeptide repeat protein [Arenicella xantha]